MQIRNDFIHAISKIPAIRFEKSEKKHLHTGRSLWQAFFIDCLCWQRRHVYKVEIILQSLLDKKCKARYTNIAKQTYQGGDGLKTRIQELRKKHKLSQEELALAVGVTRQTITSLECEKYTASLVLAYKIARYFGMSIEDVFDFSEVEVFDDGTI